MLKRLRSTLFLTRSVLLCEWSDKRVIMGFLMGVAVPFFWLRNFLDYVISTGEPVNILEAFPVVEHERGTMMFLVLGWFLIIADAPFVGGNTCYCLYRAKKRGWNFAMVLYISVQAAFYTAAVAFPMVLSSLPYGFIGKMWSYPVYTLSKDLHTDMSGEYRIAFLQKNMMQRMNVPQAFAVTALCFFLYLVLMGMILYTCNLLLGGIWGAVIAFTVHMSGYGLLFLGRAGGALVSYACPGNFIDVDGVHLARPVAVMIIFAAALVMAECGFIDKVDFHGR